MDKSIKKTEVYSIRITKEQKEVLRKNEWIKKELGKYLLDYLECFVDKERTNNMDKVYKIS